VDRKVSAVGMTRLLTDSQAMQGAPYTALWIPTLSCLLKLLELPPTAAQEDDIASVEIDLDDVSFSASFARLNTSTKRQIDPTASVQDPKQYLAKKLTEANVASGGRTFNLIKSELADAQPLLASYGATI